MQFVSGSRKSWQFVSSCCALARRRCQLQLLFGSVRVYIIMVARTLPRNKERLLWRSPKQECKRERAKAWQLHSKIPLAFGEIHAAFGNNWRLYQPRV